MKEQAPIRHGLVNPIDTFQVTTQAPGMVGSFSRSLTNLPNGFTLGRERSLMAEPGQGEQQPQPSRPTRRVEPARTTPKASHGTVQQQVAPYVVGEAVRAFQGLVPEGEKEKLQSVRQQILGQVEEKTPPAGSEPALKPVSPERVKRARKGWGDFYRGRLITPGEAKVAEKNISLGISPLSGAAVPIAEVTTYTDPTIQNIVLEVNDEISRVGIGNPLERGYVENQILRVQDLVDQGRVNAAEARRVRGILNEWRAESIQVEQEAARAERERMIQEAREAEAARREEQERRQPPAEGEGVPSVTFREGGLNYENAAQIGKDITTLRRHMQEGRDISEEKSQIQRSLYAEFKGPVEPIEPIEGAPEADWKEYGEKLKEYRTNQMRYLEQRRRLGMGFAALTRFETRLTEEEDRSLKSAIDQKNYDEFDRIAGNFKPNSDEYRGYFEHIYQHCLETQNATMLEYALEYGIERILSTADVRILEQYPQFNLYIMHNIDSLLELARSYDESGLNTDPQRSLFRYLSELQTKRYVVHELFRSMKNREQYVSGVTQWLRAEGFAFIEDEMVGVAATQRHYERVLGFKNAVKGVMEKGWLGVDDFRDADEDVKNLLERDEQLGNLKKKVGTDHEGKVVERPLRPWERSRAVVLGRAISGLSQRRAVWGLQGEVPTRVDDILQSRETEYVSRALAPLKLMPARFFTWPAAQTMLRFVLEEFKDKKVYGLFRNGKQAEGLYGNSVDALAVLDTAVTGPKDHGWRARALFLRQDEYKTEEYEGEPVTIGEYLNRIQERIAHETEDRIRGEHSNPNKVEMRMYKQNERFPYKKEMEEEFNRSVRGTIERQRLFLGILLRQELDDANKAAIWEKVAKLLPSRIASFLPRETLDILKQHYNYRPDPQRPERERKREERELDAQAIGKWTELNGKLWLVEDMRVESDALHLRNGEEIPEAEKTLEYFIEKYNRGIEVHTTLSPEGKDKRRITDAEKAIIKDIQLLGMRNITTDKEGNAITYREVKNGKTKIKWYKAEVDGQNKLVPTGDELKPGKNGEEYKVGGGFAKITFPFTAFLDDAPKTGWGKLKDSDLERLIVGDQNNLSEGTGEMVALIADPGKKLEEAIDHFKKAFHHIGSPLGKPDAQNRMESYVSSYAKMIEMNSWAKFFSTIMDAARIPRSVSEKYNLQSKAVYDEPKMAEIFTTLAQFEVISDDSTDADKDGNTQYWRMREKHKAARRHILLARLRLIMLFLGPVAGLEFFRSMLPEEAKKLGL